MIVTSDSIFNDERVCHAWVMLHETGVYAEILVAVIPPNVQTSFDFLVTSVDRVNPTP